MSKKLKMLIFFAVWLFTACAEAPPANGFYEQTNNDENNPRILTYERLATESNDQLLLVNRSHGVPGHIYGGMENVLNYVWTLDGDLLLNADALIMLRQMFNAAASGGMDGFRVTEAFRTRERQQSLYDSAADTSMVAPPGHSEHQTGFAVDISYDGVNIGNSSQGQWLMDNAHHYGFILRYPQHKTDITGFSFEPWHYRYVGQPHAVYIYENDFTLEEYIEFLQNVNHATIELNGTEYNIYYLSDMNEEIEIPIGHSYTASRDNTGGIIVTVIN